MFARPPLTQSGNFPFIRLAGSECGTPHRGLLPLRMSILLFNRAADRKRVDGSALADASEEGYSVPCIQVSRLLHWFSQRHESPSYHSTKLPRLKSRLRIYWLPMDQGSPAHWDVGTPSSRSLAKAAEKLDISGSLSYGRVRSLLEEDIFRLGVLLSKLLERLVLDQGHVGRKHHQRLGLLVLVLGRSAPGY